MTRDDTNGRFVCPECRGTIPIDPSLEAAIVRHGCALCGASVSADAFPASAST